jgi:glycosyltransferase involved in cell wall biosynthesis
MSLSKGANFIQSNDLNIVNIARVTKGKGIHKFICELIKLSKISSNQIFRNEMLTLHLFLKHEDASVEKKILLSARKLEEITGIKTNFYFGAGHQEISTIINSMPNKLPFITSKSESFSYALLEMLGFEYKPIVWFSNELVEVLKENNHCLCLKYGEVLDKNGAIPREINDFHKVQNFMKEISRTSKKKYELVLNQVFNFD